jgi:hypothetical protein
VQQYVDLTEAGKDTAKKKQAKTLQRNVDFKCKMNKMNCFQNELDPVSHHQFILY